MRSYVEGRLSLQVLPLLRNPDLWSHPLIAAAFDPDLRHRICQAADRADYVQGLRDEGCPAQLSLIRRWHALCTLIFTGLSAVPFEHLGADPTPRLGRLAAERAALARYILDLVDSTG